MMLPAAPICVVCVLLGLGIGFAVDYFIVHHAITHMVIPR